MTREEAKQTIFTKSRSYESAHQNYIHLLSLHKIIDDIFDEHEAQIKAKDEEIEKLKSALSKTISKDIVGGFKLGDRKSRSIVAMLFWEWKKQCKNCKQYNDHTFAREQKRSEAYYCFKKAYAMLKDKQC